MRKSRVLGDIDALIASSGARVLTTDLSKLAPPPPPKPAKVASPQPTAMEPGTLLVAFRVLQRPIPWTPPRVGEHGVHKSESLRAWQDSVATMARIAMARREPYLGAVRLWFEFVLVDIPGRTPPDTTNLIKGTEDAIQGTVIANDRMVCEVRATREFGPEDSALIRVFAA